MGGGGGGGDRLRPSLWVGHNADEPIKKEKEIKVFGGSLSACVSMRSAPKCGRESVGNLFRRLQQL